MAKQKQFNGGQASDYLDYYLNKYFNLFVDHFEWEGLNYRQIKYVMKKFWSTGTLAAFKIKYLDELAFAPWVRQSWDLYGEPETIQLINERGSNLIPATTQVVDKDVVIGYVQANEKPIFKVVEYYINRIANVELVLNTNLNLQKMPFLLAVDETEKEKAKNIVDRILNNDIVVTLDGVDPTAIQTVLTEAPFLVTQLHTYKVSLENELLTILGINNQGVEKQEQLQLAEVNSNNEQVAMHGEGYLKHLQDWCTRINEVLGINIWVEYSDVQVPECMGEVHDGDKPGPKENKEKGEE